jgi:DNA polymerase
VIARLAGFALAGGCGLAVAADFTIAGRSAQLGLPEIGIGLLPLVVSAPIARALGSRKALLDLVLTGRRVDAEEALRLGLVTRVVPDEALDAEVEALCRRLAAAAGQGGPLHGRRDGVRRGHEVPARDDRADLPHRGREGGGARLLREAGARVEGPLAREARALLGAARGWLEELLEEGVEHFERERAAPRPAPPAAGTRPPAPAPSALPPRQPSFADAPLAGAARGDLASVREALGECTRCRLCEGRTQIVFGDGNPHADLLFVGEGPGEEEDRRGLPFVGRAGELLTQMIERGLEIPRSEVYICNIVKCRPPRNRTPLSDEVAACRPFLDGQIEAVRPRVIVALGKPATSLLLGRDVSITRVRGTWHEYRGIPLMPTFHPAFILRQYTRENRRLVWEDLKAALTRARDSTARES